MNAPDFDDDRDDGAGGGEGFLSQLPVILWQRRWWIGIPLVAGALAAVAAIFLLPTTYRSTAVLLVQSPQLSGDVIGGLPDNSIDRRIARIREQVTSRPDLLALIDEHGLYPGERSRVPLSKIVAKMRSAIDLVPTIAETPGDMSRQNTISFALSFDYAKPAEAQAVAQDLTERILNLDASQNAAQATNAVDFLNDQANTLQGQIRQIEGQMAAVTSRNGRALAAGGVPVMTSGGSYDVQISNLQRDNATLLTQRRSLQGGTGSDAIVVAAEGQLAAAKAIYADNHPDVLLAKQRLSEAKVLAAQQRQGQPSTGSQIDQLIEFNNSQITALRAARGAENAQVAAAVSAQARGPLAEQQIAQLQQRLAAVNEQYKQVSERLLAARAGVRANDEQMGQRLSVIDPPVIPDAPYSPNRLLLGALGVAGGLGLGLVLAMLAEFVARPLRTPEAVARIAGHAPIAVVPLIDITAPRKSRWWRLRKLRSTTKADRANEATG